MVAAERWVLVLIDELLVNNLLSSIQVARYLVHSYPYVPDACAIVDAIDRLHQQTLTQQASVPQPPKPASRGRKRTTPRR